MSAKSNQKGGTLADQLSSFESRLDGRIDDVQMLADIQDGIGQMLGPNGGNEGQVRRVLQQQYEKGELRKETFQLVKSMLDGYVSERVPTTGNNKPALSEVTHVETIAEASSALDSGDAAMSSTLVLPTLNIQQPESADERVQVGSILRDRFMLQERMSGGSMGVVYKALDRRLDEAGATKSWVAIKVLSPYLAEDGQALRALQQEAAKGRCLTHPNIVRIIDLDRDDDLFFIVMEWLEGKTLADILDAPETGKLKTDRAFEIFQQIGDALEYAHRCGIVHADVKPGNIMIMPNGDAMLFDFGVARVRQKQIEDRQEFDPGVLGLLTPAYSSMQVLTGDDPIPADDVFSLACLLYRLIAGYRVFGPRNAIEAAEAGMTPQQLQGLSEDRWRALKKALSYSRVTRFETMQGFIDALNVGAAEPVMLTVPPRDEVDVDVEPQGHGSRIALLLVLLAALGGAAYQFGYLDELQDRFLPVESDFISAAPVEQAVVASVKDDSQTTVDPETSPEIFADSEPLTEASASATPVESDSPIVSDSVVETKSVDEPDLLVEADSSLETLLSEEMVDEILVQETLEEIPVEAPPPLVDFSLLPRPTAEIHIRMHGVVAKSTSVTLREGRAPATIDLIREDVALPLTLRLEEVDYSGNRSPWASGQFALAEGDFIEFPAGQDHARITLSMTSDPIREADQYSTLRVRGVDPVTSELASITVNLEDDDQRAFEATLPANTVAFAVSQISVRESDPVVQIDILRINPDNTRLVVGYVLRDITATEGEDYFAPGSSTIEFGPGQRTARLLIPLVQDFEFEDNEAFSVELSNADINADIDVFFRTAVIIRDDDS
jgi:serine/threonine protein kinase